MQIALYVSSSPQCDYNNFVGLRIVQAITDMDTMLETTSKYTIYNCVDVIIHLPHVSIVYDLGHNTEIHVRYI
jgi:hypothetical protein